MNSSEDRPHRLQQVRDEIECERARNHLFRRRLAQALSRAGARARSYASRDDRRRGPRSRPVRCRRPRAVRNERGAAGTMPEAPPAEPIDLSTPPGRSPQTGPVLRATPRQRQRSIAGPAIGRHVHYIGDYVTISVLGRAEWALSTRRANYPQSTCRFEDDPKRRICERGSGPPVPE